MITVFDHTDNFDHIFFYFVPRFFPLRRKSLFYCVPRYHVLIPLLRSNCGKGFFTAIFNFCLTLFRIGNRRKSDRFPPQGLGSMPENPPTYRKGGFCLLCYPDRFSPLFTWLQRSVFGTICAPKTAIFCFSQRPCS